MKSTVVDESFLQSTTRVLLQRKPLIVELHFGITPEVLREEYLDVYGGIQSEAVSTTRFNENSDLSTTYLGRSDRAKGDKLKAEESFPISEQGYTLGKLLDGTECQITIRYRCK